MKSTVFYLKYPQDPPDRMEQTDITFTIPTLDAYAIEFAEFSATNQMQSGQKLFNEGEDFVIKGNHLIWKNFEEPLFRDRTTYRLAIYYHGIRDYSLLFPHVKDPVLSERLGKFYEEAEICFDNGAWLSYCLMCGAVYEALLYSRLEQNGGFCKLINQAHTSEIIDAQTAETMHMARKLRNLVHGDNFQKPYVSRLQAMDARTVMDKLIKQDWDTAATNV